jgi:hypothetical protein
VDIGALALVGLGVTLGNHRLMATVIQLAGAHPGHIGGIALTGGEKRIHGSGPNCFIDSVAVATE